MILTLKYTKKGGLEVVRVMFDIEQLNKGGK